MKVCVLTLGCKVNKYESDALVFELKNKGFCASDKLEEADAYIINTCAVTNEAESKSRQMIERARKISPNAKIFVLGCASQNRPVQFEGRGVSFLQGTAGKLKILDELERTANSAPEKQSTQNLYELPAEYEDNLTSVQSLTRAFVKVQDGCNHFCTYCVIPYIRGRSRSRKVESVVEEVKKLPKDVKEVVLVGIDLSDFRTDGQKNLGGLLQALDGFGKRLRLSSLEDNLIDETFIKTLKGLKNFCPHFHLSLQSGCNRVLKKMNRAYTTSDFEKSVALIRKHFPLAGITTDVIVGFPTETDEDFEETLAFVKKINFSQVHIFPYSKREGTAAAKLYKDLPKQVKKQRAARLKEVADICQQDFFKKNKTGRVLLEEKNGQFFEGYTENYIKVFVKDNGSLAVGDVVDVRLEKLFKGGMLATLD